MPTLNSTTARNASFSGPVHAPTQCGEIVSGVLHVRGLSSEKEFIFRCYLDCCTVVKEAVLALRHVHVWHCFMRVICTVAFYEGSGARS